MLGGDAWLDYASEWFVLEAGTMRLVRIIKLAALLFLMPPCAAADSLPQLMLETGGHLGIVRSVAFFRSANRLVSAGDDKLIRIWDLATSKTEFVLRGQIGPGKEGSITALAISPDDRWLAAGGWFSADGAFEPCCGDVRLYDLAHRKQVALFKGHTDALTSLAFSPDGRLLLSGSADGSAILWDVENRTALKTFASQKKVSVTSIGFAEVGATAVTADADGVVRLWNISDGTPKREYHLNARVTTLAISPQSELIVAGLANGELRKIETGQEAVQARLASLEGTVRTLVFRNDGSALLASCDCLDTSVRAFDVRTGTSKPVYVGHDNVVTALTLAPDGIRAASAGGEGHEVHIWTLDTGRRDIALAGIGKAVWQVAFAKDAQEVAWGITDPCPQLLSCPNKPAPLASKLKLPAQNHPLGEPETVKAGEDSTFLRARTSYLDTVLTTGSGPASKRRDDTLEIREKGKIRAIIQRDATNGFMHSAFTFVAHGKEIVSGGAAGTLTVFDLDGRSIGSLIGHTDQILSVATTEDGNLLASASLDQTVRLWNVATRKLIVTLFPGADGTWIAWTPDGYYTGSPGADHIVGWQINRGVERTADYVDADQLGQHLHRPDIVERALILASAEKAVEEAEGTRTNLGELLSRSIPSFRIADPAQGTNTPEVAQVRISIEENSDPIKLVNVTVNGVQVARISSPTGTGGFSQGDLDLEVPLYEGHNDVRVSLVNDVGERSETIALNHNGKGRLDERGALYIVAIGVDEYPGLGNRCGPKGRSSCNLRFAGDDARALADMVERRLGRSHKTTVRRVLTNDGNPDDTPTAANILDAVDLFKRAKENDTLVLFVAGHGLNDRGSYRFLASDSAWSGRTLRSSTVVTWFALQEALELAKGRRILVVDTCHSGNSYNPRLGNAAYRANIIAYTATRFDQLSLEDESIGHGLFTFAFLEALDGEKSEIISTKDMASYLARRVSELAKKRGANQDPQFFRGRDAEDYLLVHP
ncbi:MAG: caspase family protein [Hyphomicrobiaceae bacterium]